ncbi:ATP synthase F0, B subunit [gut metagenome]|uniref:ATP synthase F0, B subunit n=1 Tax=gut metagenome TaxID=749906 RepID=J9GMV1_9ZZZZ
MFLAFLIVFLLMKKYGFPIIVKMVEDRKNYIDESLRNAREANERLANIQSESEALLKKASEKQALILKEAMATRDNIIKEARDNAQAESVKIINEAKAQIAIEKENALKDIRSTVADLSVQIAEKIMRRQLKQDAEQEKFIERMLDEVTQSK